MGDGLSAYLSIFLVGLDGLSRSFVLLGLVLAAGNALRFLIGRPAAAVGAHGAPLPRGHRPLPAALVRGGEPSLWWPFLLVWLGFWLGSGATVWMLLVLALVLVAVGLGLHLLRAAHARWQDEVVSGPALAVLLLTGVLVLFGLLLTVRLEVVPIPSVAFRDAVGGEALGNALTKAILPAAVLVAVLALLARGGRGRVSFVRPKHARWHIGALVVVFALFAAPLLGGNQLTFAGFATPEYGKIAYLAVLAMMLADHAYGFRIRRPRLRDARGDFRHAVTVRRHLLYPFALFGVVGFASALKHDIGPLIPVFAGTVTMVWLVVRAEVSQSLDVSRRRGVARSAAVLRTTVTFTRPMIVPLLVLGGLGLLVMVSTSYITARWDTQQNPWIYNWAQACLDPPDRTPLPAVPDGTAACQESLGGEFAGTHSQIAQSLATIADGGLWGRGLSDTTSGRLPAGSSDLVLAVIWSKLGGITVLLLSALSALLAAALVRLCRTTGRTASSERLFIGGFAGMLLAQFLFVLAATVNAVPHSGITAPFLSYGAQSTVALGFGVITAVALHYRAAPGPTPVPEHRAPFPGVRSGVPLLAFLTCVMLTWGVTVWPYTGLAENRPFCATTSPLVDAAQCSTDRIAHGRTTVRLVVGGQAQYVRTGITPSWEPVGQPTIALDDLAGIVDGSALNGVLSSGSGTSLADRLGPADAAGRAPGSVELTVDPAIQSAAATALRSDANGAGPLAGGLVVLDARSGHVLASASAPTETARPESEIEDTQQTRDFIKAHKDYYHRRPDGTPDESRKCDTDAPTPEERSDCVRWGLRAEPPARSEADLRRYVTGVDGATAPGPTVNRALGKRYGLGSTFKVVIAAAYLRGPGRTADDLIPSPPVVSLGGNLIDNYEPGYCPGTTGAAKITLRQALAVSCNTAFVQLASDLKWPVIEETARALGFSPARPQPGTAWLAGVTAGVDSVVPQGLAATDIGNAVLGGGEVEGTPLQMAVVLAAVANGGTAVQPSLVAAVTDANGGARRTITGESRPVLTPEQAGQLQSALSATTTGGTATGLAAADSRVLWVKTGTHALVEDGEAVPAQQFVRQIAWLVGAFQTARGPVSFAVAVETHDESAGARRVRWLAQQAIDKITEVRG